MHRRFDHENLKVYQMGITFCGWCPPLLEGIASRVAAKDQLDRASTSIVLNIAEGNGKRSYRDRSRFFDIARGSGVESAACLDVLVARGLVETEVAEKGKAQLFETVSMIGGLLARFAGDGRVEEDQAECGIDKEKEKE
jgi:four helix bundle protein